MRDQRSTNGPRVRWLLASVVVSCLVVACGGTASPAASSQPAPVAVASASPPSVAPSIATSAAPRPTLAPFKTETSVEFKPTLTIPNVPSTWSLDEDTPGTFILLTDSPLTAADGSPSAVYILNHGMVHPAGCANPVDPHQDAKQMTATLVALPAIVASKPKPITLGGRQGFLTEIHVKPGSKSACGTGNGTELLHSLPPTSDPTFDDGIGIGTSTALYLLNRPEGGVMAIQIDDQSGGHDLAAYEALVETLQLQP